MTREEAIKEIKSWAIPSERGREVLETLIPELAESEDEKIRKFLVDFFASYKIGDAETKLNGVRIDDILAYLEKQKEDKWSPSEDEMGVLYKLCYISSRVTDEDDTNLTRLYQDLKREYFNGHSFENMFLREKQKEQRPDSLIYDKDLDKAAREFYLSGGAASPVDSTGLVPIVRMAEFGATWMKERMEKEQKPCWNPTEEDVALFNKALTTNASLSPQERAKLDILRMKFKHRPVIEQKEQKPAEWSAKGRRGRIGSTPEHIRKKAENFLSKMEPPYDADDICSAYETGAMENANSSWSEEDEKMLRTIISDGSRGVELDSKQISWLKSLRPSWKPSEKQMKALEDAFRKDGSDEYRKTINSLYQQLKRL